MSGRDTIVNIQELEWEALHAHGDVFGGQFNRLGRHAGGRMLGCSLTRVEPGKSAFPAHIHHANEEAIFVLSGGGTLRLGSEEVPVRAGDYIAVTPSGPAHQLRNTGIEPLEYLCISTMIHPEVAEHPDSGKIGVLAGAAPGSPQEDRRIWKLFQGDADVDYFDGE